MQPGVWPRRMVVDLMLLTAHFVCQVCLRLLGWIHLLDCRKSRFAITLAHSYLRFLIHCSSVVAYRVICDHILENVFTFYIPPLGPRQIFETIQIVEGVFIKIYNWINFEVVNNASPISIITKLKGLIKCSRSRT